MYNRRDALKHSAAVAGLLVGAGVFSSDAFAAFNQAAFKAKNLNEALQALGAAGAPSESPDVILSAPNPAENGAVVPISVSTTLVGIKQFVILVEKNPVPLAARFNLTDSLTATIATRIKMAESSVVYAVAVMHDGRALFAKKAIDVIQGGCAA